MQRKFKFPGGPLVNSNGAPTIAGNAYLEGIDKMGKLFNALHEIADLDSGTSYTANQLRDKIIEIMTALKG